MRREIVIQKYGGATIDTIEKIQKVAAHIKKTNETKAVVVVVSAMGNETDDLLAMALKISQTPSSRELDKLLVTGEEKTSALMAMAIQALGIEVISFTGFQIGLETDATYTKAKVIRIRNLGQIQSLIEAGKIPVVAGFQGVIEGTNEVVTLGRGGSDITAVSLAGALRASFCEIYKDVDGIFTVDPRIVPGAKRLTRIPYDQMVDLAEGGAAVLMTRCVILARNLGVKIKVLLSPSLGETIGGTLVDAGANSDTTLEGLMWAQPAIAIQKGLALVNVAGVPNQPMMAAKILGAIRNINLIDATQGQGEEKANISVLCETAVAPIILENIKESLKETAGITITTQTGIVGLTLADPLMPDEPGYVWRACEAVGRVGVNIETISSSGATILVSIREEGLERAARALAEEFNLLA